MAYRQRIGRWGLAAGTIVVGTALMLHPGSAPAHIEAPYTLGRLIHESAVIIEMTVEKVDREKNLIIYRKNTVLKGQYNPEIIRHNIGRPAGPFPAREWQWVMEWAEVGKKAVFFFQDPNGPAETCIDAYWYQMHSRGEWYEWIHGEAGLLRSYCGKPEKLVGLVRDILAGREVIHPCVVNANREEIHNRRAKVQRCKASLKLMDYNEKRDFVGWGGEDIRRLAGYQGFSQFAALTRVDPEAQAVSIVDIDGDGKLDLCLLGAGKAAIMHNSSETFAEVGLPGNPGGRAAVWADYNGDGLLDLLVAASNGPRLFTNLGKGVFRDDSALLPVEPFATLTAAAWMDYDGDGKPDILLANGYGGLRLYRNVIPANAQTLQTPPKWSDWHYAGPFEYAGGGHFDKDLGPEKGVDLAAKYSGKGQQKVGWTKGAFPDGQVNNLALFKPEHNRDAVVYLYREVECTTGVELPLSLGSDDTLKVWVNGQLVLTENVYRACAADQNRIDIRLKPGKNTLLLKIGQGDGDWAFYFRPGNPVFKGSGWFEDVSNRVGLGPNGIASTVKGDALAVADVNNDGRPDFLYSAGRGVLVRNTPKGFVTVDDSGLDFQPGGIGPVFGDFDNDGFIDLLVPQASGCQLYRNTGQGRFVNVTAKAGDLPLKTIGQPVCAAWGDVDNDGQLDLVVGCLRGPNRFYRNRGNGTFEDATVTVGLHQRVFNTQAIALADLNNDGALDLILNNEGQDACLLLGDPTAHRQGRTPVILAVKGSTIGGRVIVRDAQGKTVTTVQISGGDGRGGQAAPLARVVVPPGTYRAEFRDSSGKVRQKEVAVTDRPVRIPLE